MINIHDQPPIKGFRHPTTVIAYAVRACHGFALSLRDAEDLMAERGVSVSCETIWVRVDRFGPKFAAKIRRGRPRPADKRYLDEVAIQTGGQQYRLWRAIDARGDVFDILVQSRRNRKAATRFLHKLLKRWGKPRVMVTDKLRSCGVAKADIAPGIEHRQHKEFNNTAEASHRHTRRREKIMGCFKSPRQAQRFLSVHDQTAALFRPKRHRLSAHSCRHAGSDAFDLWIGSAAELAA